MSNEKGKLYIVATPIGHLADISLRAIDVLKAVDLIAAEDTRNSKKLLNEHAIQTKMMAYHEHNEDSKSAVLLDKLLEGSSIALISDAGTPLINDPGYSLVRKAHESGIKVVPLPGACAIIAALSSSGLATARFSFEGFLPRTSSARQTILASYVKEPKTLVFYESSHRILACLEDVAQVYAPSRKMTVARELTKTFETIVSGSVKEILEKVRADSNMQRGEFVVLIEGLDKKASKLSGLSDNTITTLNVLMKECSLKTAVKLTVELTGDSKKEIYAAALKLAGK
ncbi:MAG: 16S rRNA (cytidine(1402)-2'-O)-methyltransferase [Piscirickettsiaceae bacterium]|nr:MAG: 16S rRNA (cytidine(1402)-2'-O)-methyltransferase [Piscirickettsiaceae bacterium]PCI70816.1 MAG: 16S rRNA (cytidine(1402)-2'-O)-methyltransferase [Piscirickettsiaceae bacterium]